MYSYSFQVAVGFFDGLEKYELPHSMNLSIKQIATDSNMIQSGKWIFKVTDSVIETPGAYYCYVLPKCLVSTQRTMYETCHSQCSNKGVAMVRLMGKDLSKERSCVPFPADHGGQGGRTT